MSLGQNRSDDHLRPSWPLRAAVLLVVLLTGCAFVENMINRQPQPDTRIMLERGQHMDFSRVSRRNRQGQSLDEYRCPEKQVMVCDGAGGVSFDCACYSMAPGTTVF